MKKEAQKENFEKIRREKKKYIPPQIIITYQENELISDKAYCVTFWSRAF